MTEPLAGRKHIAAAGTTLLTLTAVVSTTFAGFVEIVLAAPLGPSYYAVALALCAVGTATAIVADPLAARKTRWIASFATVCLVLLTMHLLPWTSRKPFLQDLSKVQQGMHRTEVESLMAGYLRGTGWPKSPFGPPNESAEYEISNSIVFRHSDHGDFNSDWGVVRFEDDHVVSVEFLAD